MKLNMTKVAVAADASEDVVAASAQKKTGTNDEEKGNHESKAEDSCGEGPNRWATIPTRKNNVLLWLILCIMLVFIVVGLSVGLTRRSQYQQKESSATVSSDNLSIFDEALALLESTPLQDRRCRWRNHLVPRIQRGSAAHSGRSSRLHV